MVRLYEAKEYIQRFYAKFSKQIHVGWHFLLALFTFWCINDSLGFLKPLANHAITVGLAVICTFLSPQMTAVIATLLVITHLSALAPGIAIAVSMIMIILFALYFRFAPRYSVILLLTPLAFVFHVPVWIPVLVGLVGGSTCVVPVVFGVVIYYMLSYVEVYSTFLGTVTETGVIGQLQTFIQQLSANKEMWMVIVASVISLLLVYFIRRLSVDFAWMIAAVAGVLANLIMMTFGHVMVNIKVSYAELIVASVLAVGVAFIFYIFAVAVDYTQCEYLQFEDDEHYYYVKAVPKVSMSVREKTVQKINVRQETGMMDIDEVKKAADESNSKEISEATVDFDESEIQRLIEEELNK